MKLPFLKNKKETKEYFLALLLDDEKVSSVILEETDGIIKIVGKHEERFNTPLENLLINELITFVDKTISRAEEILPPEIETHKTIFGVKENWIEPETKKIKKEYLAKLKKVCDSLDLSPIGFMVINEAIANLIQHEEGSPLSAIVVELREKKIHLILFKGGNVSETVSGPIEHSIPITVDTLLKSFTTEVLPTKLLLFHTNESKTLSQHFINHEWSKSLPFLHVPQIIVLPKDFDVRAVAYGASQQMGFEMLSSSKEVKSIEEPSDEKNENIPITEDIPPVSLAAPAGQDFGFILDQDIAKQPFKKDLTKTQSNIAITEHNLTQEENFDDVINAEKSIDNDDNNLKSSNEKTSLFAGIFASLPKISLPKINQVTGYFSKNRGLKLPIIILGAILIIGISIILFYFYFVKTQIVLSVKPKVVTEDTSVIFSTTRASDFSKNIISSHGISTSIDGEVSTATTGKKDTGNKAKGNVTIYNNGDSQAQISSGTSLKSNNGLVFITDKDINIASSSGDIFSGTKPGTAQVNVTAKDIGTEPNLPSGSKFSIGSNSSLAAKNDSAFSGGNKKTITVVSSADLAKLKSDLPKSLEKKAIEELTKKIGGSETILPGFSNTGLENPKFDKGVDDEASKVKLNATVNFEGASYQKNDLENFNKSILKDHYSQDISFAENSLKNEINDVKTKNTKEISATVKITAGLLPKIDNNEVINKLKNKSSKEAKEILNSLPQVAKSEIKFSPNIFFLSNLFPRLPKNISVLIKSDD